MELSVYSDDGEVSPVQSRYIKDFVTFPDVLIMGGLTLVGVLFTLSEAGRWQVWLSLFIGMAVYGISEYVTHRFVFHMKAPKNPLLLQFMKRIHYDHHADPNDLKLLFLPIWYSLPNIIVVSLIFWAITGNSAYTVPFATGIAGFLLYYEWTHFVAHRPIQPRTRFGRYMKKMHLWHHYKNENYWYGVTHPAMDVLLGTLKDEKQIERSQTAKDLEMR